MKKSKKDGKVVHVDENGKVINPDGKKVDLKKIGLTALKVVGGVVVSVVVGVGAFCLVGLAMSANSDGEGETSTDVGDGTVTFTPNEPAESSDSNGSTEE